VEKVNNNKKFPKRARARRFPRRGKKWLSDNKNKLYKLITIIISTQKRLIIRITKKLGGIEKTS
jgi:hypothetical protein